MQLFHRLILSVAAACVLATPVFAAPTALEPMARSAVRAAADIASHTPVAPAVAEGRNAAAGAVSTDPAKIAIGEQIFTNLHFFELSVYGGKQGIKTVPDVKTLSAADQDLVCVLFADEMDKRRASIVHDLAAANVDVYSMDQLNQLLALSKIKFIQDLVLFGADPSLATPDPASMTPAEKTLAEALIDKDWVMAFFQNVDPEPVKPQLQASIVAAFTRFAATRQPAK